LKLKKLGFAWANIATQVNKSLQSLAYA